MSHFVDNSSSTLSSRGEQLLNRPSLSYIDAVRESFSNLYNLKNSTGKILLAVAENKSETCSSMLLQKISTDFTSGKNVDSSILPYTDPTGLPSVKKSIASFLKDNIFHQYRMEESVGKSITRFDIDESNLVISPGCTATLNQLSVVLFEANDSILVPTPCYPAFDHDFYDLGSVHVVDIIPDFDNSHPSNPFSPLRRENLEAAYIKANKFNHPPKAILLTNPSNPLGIIYSNEEINMILSWASEKRLHVIVDELYALSTIEGVGPSYITPSNYIRSSSTSSSVDHKHNKSLKAGSDVVDTSPTIFTSVVSLLNNQLGDHVHILWSLSKDFASSGIRVGVLYSQNKSLLHAIGNFNDSMQVSNIAQIVAKNILDDREFVNVFLRETRFQLRNSYEILRKKFKDMGIKVIPASSGLFAFCDLRVLLSDNSFQAEDDLFQILVKRGVVLTPGKCCHCSVPGFFRICYAWVSPETLIEGIKRIKEYFLEFLMTHGSYGMMLCLAMENF
eukprot:gene7178-9788_t